MSIVNLEDVIYFWRNERDMEVPSLLASVNRNLNEIQSLLDVGACYSCYTYAADVKRVLKDKKYHGVDLFHCEKTEKIVDRYYTSNVKNIRTLYSYVSCISTLEHVGIKPYKLNDYKKEQKEVFSIMCQLAESCLFASFPFGEEGLYDGEYSNITKQQLEEFSLIATREGFLDINWEFISGNFTDKDRLFKKVDFEEASKIPMEKEKGLQCICILEFKK